MKKLDMIAKNYILLIFSIIIPFTSIGQSRNTAIDKMNDVKLDESFIYGEGSHANKDTAYDYAISNVLSCAIELRFDKGNNEKINATDIQPIVRQIIHFDGKRYNILVYIQRNQILSLGGHSDNSKSPSNTDSQYKKSVAQNKPHNPSTIKDALTDERITLLPNVSKDILYTLCTQDNWTEIKGFLSTYKKQGRIKETGFSTNVSEIPIDACRILIDERYGILSILTPDNSIKKINLKTNQLDTESNYPNCKVIVWFK